MKLSDYTPEQLIGMDVLITSRYRSSLGKIEKVNKRTFSVSTESQPFSLLTGYQQGGDKWAVTNAEIISPEKAEEIKKEWREKRLTKEAIKQITDSLPTLTLPILQEILKLIPKTTTA